VNSLLNGTVFKMTTSGTLTTLYSFCSQQDCADGLHPLAPLIQATNGNLYGTAAEDYGTVFEITPDGALTTLHGFCAQGGACSDGENPYTGLVQAANGDRYGTTQNGGQTFDGTVFKITPTGSLTTLHNFGTQTDDGSHPSGNLVLGASGDLFGITMDGGAKGYGTIFKITPSGTLTTLHSFCAQTDCADGQSASGLMQDTNGDFYGTTLYGGANGNSGTVFRLSLGYGAFVKTLPVSGKVGVPVKILGTNLTGATSVSFNGIPAAFAVVSATEITTTVPTGATTGKVQVITPGGTLLSNVAFDVVP
jgi:uncharacterized repeat protein (TIGR03803 family)